MGEIDRARIQELNEYNERPGKEYVLYWMQHAQRTVYNHALEYAIERANGMGLPVLVYFGLTDRYPAANLRHYMFMLEGLKEVKNALKKRGIHFVVEKTVPWKGAADLGEDAALVVTDRGYLRHLRAWRQQLVHLDCRVVQVETDVAVPVEQASEKEEYAAYTIRKKITTNLPRLLTPVPQRKVKVSSRDYDLAEISVEHTEKLLDDLDIDTSVGPSSQFTGGYSPAETRMRTFIRDRLEQYPTCSNDPTAACISDLSPYLHFGQISPIQIALSVRNAEVEKEAQDAFLEQLIVRRELAINFVSYNDHYDRFDAVTGWARETLMAHEKDPREYTYTCEQLDRAETHDPYWNAAQMEMVKTGKMHSYMRMYWGKKILEWAETPKEAYRIAVTLNDTYELDGRDPNGYAGVAWCFGKHDRAWKERPIYGKVRYMSASGLKRKFDADVYVDKINSL